jgi:hypothetical protein
MLTLLLQPAHRQRDSCKVQTNRTAQLPGQPLGSCKPVPAVLLTPFSPPSATVTQPGLLPPACGPTRNAALPAPSPEKNS